MDGNSIEFSPKREVVTVYEYDVNGNVTKTVETTNEIVKTEDKILSVKSVDHDQVDEMIKSGYQPKEIFAKNVIMILTESANKAFMESLKEK